MHPHHQLRTQQGQEPQKYRTKTSITDPHQEQRLKNERKERTPRPVTTGTPARLAQVAGLVEVMRVTGLCAWANKNERATGARASAEENRSAGTRQCPKVMGTKHL